MDFNDHMGAGAMVSSVTECVSTYLLTPSWIFNKNTEKEFQRWQLGKRAERNFHDKHRVFPKWKARTFSKCNEVAWWMLGEGIWTEQILHLDAWGLSWVQSNGPLKTVTRVREFMEISLRLTESITGSSPDALKMLPESWGKSNIGRKKSLLGTSGLYHCYSSLKTGDDIRVQSDLLKYRKLKVGLKTKENSPVTQKLVVRLQSRGLSLFWKLVTGIQSVKKKPPQSS